MASPPKMNKLMLSPGIMQHLERQLDDPSLSEEDEYLYVCDFLLEIPPL
jgi:hypothetical protein